MDTGLVILLSLVVLAAAAVLLFLLRGGRGTADGGRQGAELAGRLDQMATSQAGTLAAMQARLQAQEQALAKLLEERLDQVASRVNETLEKTAKAQSATLGELRERIAKIDAAQVNINELSSQVVSLNQILSNKQERGAFGEMQLQDLVQSVLPPSAYKFQAQIGAGKRVDCLLELPMPPGPIAIDAKFPLESYKALRAATDEAQRQQAARAFRADMLKHIADIAEKYIVPGETAEAALLFLPSEAVYAELHANFGDVVDQSYRKRVFVVSPTTLWATLNTIRAVLKDVRMRELASVVQKEVHMLLEDIRRLGERVDNLQKHFTNVNDDIRQIGISRDKVTKRAERIEELEFETPEPAAPLAASEHPALSGTSGPREAGGG
jgi:DNA recombination protein RmuC